MKKFLTSFLCINLFCANAAFAAPSITDDFAASTLDKNLRVSVQTPAPIVDDFADTTLSKNLQIQDSAIISITDDFAKNTLNQNLKIQNAVYTPIVQDFLPHQIIREATKEVVYQKGNAEKTFDFEDLSRTVVKISPLNYYTTRTNLVEGRYIDFVVKEDVRAKNIYIKKNTPVRARVETVSPNEVLGVPADLIVDNFVIDKNIKAVGQISKKGANRSVWVYPTSIVLTPFFGLGLLLLTIRGGHVKLKPSNTYEVYLEGSQNL